MKGRAIALATMLAATALCAPARADGPLSVDAAVGRAIAVSPLVEVAVQRLKAAEARAEQAGLLANPSLTLSVDQAPLAAPVSGNYMVGLSEPVSLGGFREARRAVADLEKAQAEAEVAAVRRQLTGRVRDAFARLLFAREEARLMAEDEGASGTLLAAAQRRERAGELAKVEVLRAEVDASRARHAHEAADSRERQARAQLAYLMGVAPDTVDGLVMPREPEVSRLPTLQRLVALALKDRPELRAAATAVDRERLLGRLAEASRWDGGAVTAFGGLVAGQPGFSTAWTVPMPVWGRAAVVAEAEAGRQRAEAERSALEAEVTLEVAQAFDGAHIEARQVSLFTSRYLPQAERLATNAQHRFLVGEGSGLEVAEARSAAREAREAHQRAVLAYRLAIGALERATGADWPFDLAVSP